MDSMDYHWNYLSNPFQILQKWSLGWGNQHQTLQVGSLNDYILFPDPRVMDSMDYHWKYLSNPLKTLHDSNRECSRDSGGDSKEEDFKNTSKWGKWGVHKSDVQRLRYKNLTQKLPKTFWFVIRKLDSH